MGNWAGLIVIGVAAFLVVSGVQGSWQKFFPWLMSSSSSSSGSTPPSCPPGQTLVNGVCTAIPEPRSGV